LDISLRISFRTCGGADFALKIELKAKGELTMADGDGGKRKVPPQVYERMRRRGKKSAAAFARKHPAVILVAVILIIAIVVGACLWYFKFGGKEFLSGGGDGGAPPSGAYVPASIKDGDFSVHFLELGNKYTGDSVYIKSGDTDILIDAGSKTNSGPVISDYIDGFVSDGKLEYVIATHAHEDHIAGFYGTGEGAKRVKGVFERFDTGVIIDFPLTDKADPSDTSVLGRYYAARNAEVEEGAKHYTALECFSESVPGAQRVYDIGGGAELEILYNYYYDHPTPGKDDENDYSVAVIINRGENHYLFTGDMEKDGEDRMTDYYASRGGLPKCVLFKAGHHGSKTSSNVKLLAAIQPEYVVLCTCVGSNEYRADEANKFPSQDFINRVSVYTDNVYATTIVLDYNDAGCVPRPFNGTIVILTRGGQIYVRCTDNDTKLKDTAWFKENRSSPPSW
jgi:competence protein ComEC